MSDLNKVLIVDDSSIICKLLHNYLEKLNFEIIGIASSGKEALELFGWPHQELICPLR